jgi:type VI secretion system secreted protein Hcp
MAENIHLTLTSHVQGVIEGDSTLTSLGRANTIEIVSFTHALRGRFERSSGLASGRRYYEPISFTKRLDKSTPKLREALTRNETLSGRFEWFRPNPSGDGSTQQFLTITFSGARLTAVVMRLADTLIPATAGLPPLEDVSMVFNTIEWQWIPGGIVAQDAWESQV